MTATSVKAALVRDLEESGALVRSRLRELPVSKFDEGRYENGWNGRQILAHIASIEWTYSRLVQLAADGPDAATPGARATRIDAAGQPMAQASPLIDEYNARQVERRADYTIDALLEEFTANRQRTIASVEAADATLLSKQVRSAGGISGSLAEVIRAVAIEHVLSHVSDIAGELSQGTRW